MAKGAVGKQTGDAVHPETYALWNMCAWVRGLLAPASPQLCAREGGFPWPTIPPTFLFFFANIEYLFIGTRCPPLESRDLQRPQTTAVFHLDEVPEPQGIEDIGRQNKNKEEESVG